MTTTQHPTRAAAESAIWQDFTLKNSRGQTLHVSHWTPDTVKGRPHPCVIWLHGNSSSREEALTIMDSVIPLRISLVALDFSGCGHSEGDFVTLGWHERDDVSTVVTHLRANKNISSIVLWGRSMGAATGTHFARADFS